jgi:hypothetical protein
MGSVAVAQAAAAGRGPRPGSRTPVSPLPSPLLGRASSGRSGAGGGGDGEWRLVQRGPAPLAWGRPQRFRVPGGPGAAAGRARKGGVVGARPWRHPARSPSPWAGGRHAKGARSRGSVGRPHVPVGLHFACGGGAGRWVSVGPCLARPARRRSLPLPLAARRRPSSPAPAPHRAHSRRTHLPPHPPRRPSTKRRACGPATPRQQHGPLPQLRCAPAGRTGPGRTARGAPRAPCVGGRRHAVAPRRTHARSRLPPRPPQPPALARPPGRPRRSRRRGPRPPTPRLPVSGPRRRGAAARARPRSSVPPLMLPAVAGPRCLGPRPPTPSCTGSVCVAGGSLRPPRRSRARLARVHEPLTDARRRATTPPPLPAAPHHAAPPPAAPQQGGGGGLMSGIVGGIVQGALPRGAWRAGRLRVGMLCCRPKADLPHHAPRRPRPNPPPARVPGPQAPPSAPAAPWRTARSTP